MANEIYLNLPVKDLNKSIHFFTQLGFTFNQQFTDENATCMILGENMYVMLLNHAFFKNFTKKEIADAHKTTECIVALSVNSRAEVEEMVRKAQAAGGTSYLGPQDHGWMYQDSFEDLDGHQWEILYMDMNAIPQNP